jgi:hypothetical protein
MEHKGFVEHSLGITAKMDTATGVGMYTDKADHNRSQQPLIKLINSFNTSMSKPTNGQFSFLWSFSLLLNSTVSKLYGVNDRMINEYEQPVECKLAGESQILRANLP